MFSLLFTASFIIGAHSCSILVPNPGTYYISQVQLLDATSHPDTVLLEIQRTEDPNGIFTWDDPSNGPWCKLMSVIDGSVTPVVNCTDYDADIRPYASTDSDPTSTTVSCQDNCDGSTATCNITRSGIEYVITNIPYLASSASCAVTVFGSIFQSFTINDITTTYIIFSTNAVGIQFDDTSSPPTYNVLSVDTEGDWSYVTPSGGFGVSSPSVYSDVNVLQVPLPCCLCYGWKLNTYTIEADPTNVYDQIFTLTSLGWGGSVDTIQSRAINNGLFFSTSVTIYDLLNAGSSTFEPDLCDVIVNCEVSPCQSSTCSYYPTAQCIDDYCGGCNARWYCGGNGGWEVTSDCGNAGTSPFACPTPAPTTPTPVEPVPKVCTLGSDCTRTEGFRCRRDPVCRVNSDIRCRDVDRVCVDYLRTRVCSSEADCDTASGYSCLTGNNGNGYCIKYEYE